MCASTWRTGAMVMAIGAALFGHLVGAEAQQPTSLLQLFNTIPKSPTTAQEADKLLDWNGESSTTSTRGGLAAMPALKAGLDAHETAVGKIIEAANAKINTRIGVPSTAEYAKGAAAAGIDLARMQTDPGYAKEMQAKMKAMSPAELMAMTVAMRQGMGMRGSVAVYDPPAVKAAAEAGHALMFPDQQSGWRSASDRRWAEVAKQVEAIDAKFAPKYLKRPMCGGGEGGGGEECQAAEARWLAALPQQTQLMLAHHAEVLKVESAAFEEERAMTAADVRKAEQLLVGAQYGALSQEPGNPSNIMMLDAVTAERIRALAVRLEAIVKQHAEVGHCGSKHLLGTCWQQ